MLELRINGHTADIKEESIIAVTKQYESVHNPLLYYADWSKTIKLPISANNNAIFSNFNRLDSTVTNLSINPLKKIPCMILNNQEKVLEGYCKLENVNTIWTDECYEITIYSTFGLIMNELKLLTFNKNAVDVDQKYIIDSPLSNDLVINRNLVLQSFEAPSHYISGSNVTDWIGFMPTYQGKYSDFSSDKEQILSSGRIEDMSKERDEHYTREFRSYYQQPYIWVDKLWQVARDKINMITDYTMVLDGSWFNTSNPYYSNLIYSCPSLFNADSNFRVKSEIYNDKTNIVKFNRPSKSPSLDTHHYYHVTNFTSSGVMELFDSATGIFNKDSNFGSTKVSGRFRLALFASNKNPQDDGKHFCKIRKDNPFYVRVYAENATTGNRIYGASKTVLLYSCEHDVGENTFDEKIDLGIADISNLGFFSGSDRPMIANTGYYQPSDTQDSSSHYVYNHGWQIQFDFALNVNENVPYKVYIEVWNANNGDPFEYTGSFYNLTWDWLWVDDFNTSVGDHNDKGYSMYFDTINVSCVTTENLRTGSAVSLYRVFPKDVTLCDVLLNYSKMFGLVWDVNEEEKTVTVMTRNMFFEDYRILDWSDKIDRSKEFKFAPLNFDKRYVEFNFEDGDCTRLENYQSTYQVGYGTKRLDTGYDFNSDTNKLFEKITPSVICQKRQFSCMMNTEFENSPNFVGYNYMVYPNEHYVDNDDNGSNAGMSGAFYFRNGNMAPDSRLSYKDVNGWDVYFITDDTEHMIKTQEYCWNQCGESTVLGYSLPDISTISNKFNGLRYSVHFAAPRDYYFEAPEDATIKYVYDSFWRRYINERYCSQNKKLTAYVYLTIDEFKNIDFREFIKIDNILYHIDKIYDFNYNSESPVKMDLVQVWDMTAYTEGQHNMPYLYTDQTIYLTTQDQTFPIHTTYNDVYVYRTLPWVTISIDNTNHTMTIRANGTTDTVRFGWITITHRNNAWSYVDWSFLVMQYPSPNYRLDVDQNTVLFDEMGGTKTVTIDCHDTSNYAISVTGGAGWMSARIREYWQTVEMEERRTLLHLDITARPMPWPISRATSITLSITAGDQTFTQVINVAQQGGTHHSTDIDDGIITGGGSGIEVFDYQGNHVDTLYSGQTYHFNDLFPEEIDVNSLQITGGGSVNIKGNSGLQTIEFIPQLSDGKEVGGGLITAKTLNGKVVSYPYNVQVEGGEPAPNKRHIIVDSGEYGMFTVDVTPSVMQPKTTNFFEYDLVDGTVVKLTAVPNEEMAFSSWVNGVGGTYTTPVVTFTVGSALVGQDGYISYKCEFVKSNNLVTLTVNGGGGNITVGNDPTQYNPLIRTVAVGTTIANIKAAASTSFVKWSDGSTINPRDYTVMSDTVLTPIFTHATQNEVTIDGGGLNSVDDYITLSINGTPTLKTGIGGTDLTKLPANTTYAFVLDCQIKDLNSKFNWFKQVDKRNTNYYYNNPASYNYQMGASSGIGATGNTIITVSTVPSMVYWTTDDAVDYPGELRPKQDWLLDPVFKSEKYDSEIKIEVEQDKPLTLALTTDWKLEKAVDDQDRDVLSDMAENLTSNGSWMVYFLPDTRDATHIILYLVKA